MTASLTEEHIRENQQYKKEDQISDTEDGIAVDNAHFGERVGAKEGNLETMTNKTNVAFHDMSYLGNWHQIVMTQMFHCIPNLFMFPPTVFILTRSYCLCHLTVAECFLFTAPPIISF